MRIVSRGLLGLIRKAFLAVQKQLEKVRLGLEADGYERMGNLIDDIQTQLEILEQRITREDQ